MKRLVKKSAVFAVLMCLCLTFCFYSATAKSLFNYAEANMSNSVGTGDKKYEQDFLRITELNDDRTEAQGGYFYRPLYEYYSESEENATPDYVLIYAGQTIGSPSNAYGKYGDYVVNVGGTYVPYALGLCVYIPEKNEVIGLREAYDTSLANLEAVFTDYGLGEVLGDANGDRKLNVKDATQIQKCLAGIGAIGDNDRINGICESGSEEVFYISDFNCDGVRNIKDATAIQKHLAKLP